MNINIGDRVRRNLKYDPYEGVVVGFYENRNDKYIRVKRDDGATGMLGNFWQIRYTPDALTVISEITLENE